MTQALQTIERRVNELGVAEPIIARHSEDDQILVQLPGVTDVARAKEIIKSTAHARAEAGRAGAVQRRSAGAPGLRQQPAAGPADSARARARRRRPGDRADDGVLRRAARARGHRPRPAQRAPVARREQPAGGQLLAQQRRARASSAPFTGANINRQLAIVLDNRVYSAPNINSRIDDDGIIQGSFTQQEAARPLARAAIGRAAGER